MNNKSIVYITVIYVITALKVHGKSNAFNLFLLEGKTVHVSLRCLFVQAIYRSPRKYFALDLAKHGTGTDDGAFKT